MRAGCNPSVLNSAHESPLHIATRHGQIAVINYLLSLDIQMPPDILLLASRKDSRNKTNLIRFLVDKGATFMPLREMATLLYTCSFSPAFAMKTIVWRVLKSSLTLDAIIVYRT